MYELSHIYYYKVNPEAVGPLDRTVAMKMVPKMILVVTGYCKIHQWLIAMCHGVMLQGLVHRMGSLSIQQFSQRILSLNDLCLCLTSNFYNLFQIHFLKVIS